MDRVTEIVRDGFNALGQLRDVDDASLPAPEQLHARLRSFVDELLHRAGAAGFGREESNDLAYPIVALADELVLSKRSEALRLFWSGQLLQLHYFQENVAGEAFFTRLAEIRKDPRRAELVLPYYLALAFVFQGRYRVRGGDGLARDLARGRAVDVETLSPSGERPSDRLRGAGRGGPLVWIAAGLVALSAAVYVGLRVSLAAQVDAVADRVAAVTTR
jgi:type VI secretion system protein ImpK